MRKTFQNEKNFSKYQIISCMFFASFHAAFQLMKFESMKFDDIFEIVNYYCLVQTYNSIY